MTRREWLKIASELASSCPGFELTKVGLVKEDVWWAQCLYGDRTSDPKVYELEAFVLPFFVPTEYIYLSYGFRVGHSWSTASVSPELRAALPLALERLDKKATWEGLAAASSQWHIDTAG